MCKCLYIYALWAIIKKIRCKVYTRKTNRNKLLYCNNFQLELRPDIKTGNHEKSYILVEIIYYYFIRVCASRDVYTRS